MFLKDFFEESQNQTKLVKSSPRISAEGLDFSFILYAFDGKVLIEFLYGGKPNLQKSFKLMEQAVENIEKTESLLENCYVEARCLKDFQS